MPKAKRTALVNSGANLDIVLDAGNSTTKCVALGAPVGVKFPSAVHAETRGVYEARVETYRNQPSVLENTVVFASVMQPADVGGYIVGAQAESLGRFVNLSGVGKYAPGYMDILFLAALQKIAPNGHDSVRVALAYPVGASAHVNAIRQCLYANCVPAVVFPDGTKSKAKVHRIRRWDGEVVEYALKLVSAWEEPIGGVFRFFTHVRDLDIAVGQRVLLVDIGGKISSMTPISVVSGERFEVLYAQARHFSLGVNDVKRTLEAELIRFDPDTFRVVSVPPTILEEALRGGGMVRVRGEIRDYSIPVANACAQLIRQIGNVFYSEFGGGLDIDHVAFVGGGSGLLFDLLCKNVFADHHSVHLADDKESIEFANVRGAAYSFSLFLSSLEA